MLNFIRYLYILDSLIRSIFGIPITTAVTTAVRKVTCANNVTWTASNNGGFVQLAGTAHGLTSTSVGAALYLTNTPTNWTALSYHTITSITDANTIQTSTPWVTGMGTAPTFALINTEIPVVALTLPVLKANSRVSIENTPVAAVDAGATTDRVRVYLNSTQLTNFTFNASSNASSPIRSGFKNVGSVSIQKGLYGVGSGGFTGASAPADGTVNTGVAATLSLVYMMSVINAPMECNGYILKVDL